MKTEHKIYNTSLSLCKDLEEESVDLIVTSPPYPMIEMWDECFKEQNNLVSVNMENKDIFKAWLEMHNVLNDVWYSCCRVLKQGGIICINIGDATRTFDGLFQMFSNKTPIVDYFIHRGFVALPEIIWRKRTNAPNKFMGSGMYPPGAYVTLEHENILIFRKGNKKEYKGIDKENRQESAYFYNERNVWFSDLWELTGVTQKGVQGSRERTGAYPIEIPYRLINMFSCKGEVVLDPFAGSGTTMMASIMSCRNSLNFEIDSVLCEYMKERVEKETNWNKFREERLQRQAEFIRSEKEKGKQLYFNDKMNIEVKTRQEKEIFLPEIKDVSVDKSISVMYNKI